MERGFTHYRGTFRESLQEIFERELNVKTVVESNRRKQRQSGAKAAFEGLADQVTEW